MVLEAIRAQHSNAAIEIIGDRTVERGFGWLFLLTSADASGPVQAPAKFPRQVIVNRYSGQIVAASIEHTSEQFIKIFEELLAQHDAHESALRLTTSSPTQWREWWERRVARQAAQSGLYQPGGPEK